MIRTQLKETKNTEAILARMPIELREKQLKKALGRGVRVMAKEARKKAPVEQNDDDDVHIKKSIRTGARSRGSRVWAFATVRGLAAVYSLALEYGHDLIAWGRKTDKRVEKKSFWRPAADTTEPEQHREVVKSLKNDLDDLANA